MTNHLWTTVGMGIMALSFTAFLLGAERVQRNQDLVDQESRPYAVQHDR